MIAWIKKYWEVVVGGALLVLGFVFGVLLKKSPVIVQGADPKKVAVDEKVALEEAQIQKDVAQKQADLEAEHAKDIQTVIIDETAKEPALEKDSDATNAYLKEVGQAVRGEKS